MNKDQLIHEIGSKLVEDIGARKKDWTQLVLVAQFEGDDPEMTGFAYFPNGESEPVAPKNFESLDLLVKLRDVMAVADKKPPWRAALIRIDRDTGEITFEFEYEKTDRWAITLRNSNER